LIESYRNNQILEIILKKVILNFETKMLDSDRRLMREIYSHDDGHRSDEVYMIYDQIAEIYTGNKVFWLSCGRKIQKWPKIDCIADLMLMNTNHIPFSNEKDKKGQELLEIVIKKYSKFGKALVCAYDDGRLSFDYCLKLAILPEEMMEKFVIQKPEFNPKYLFETGESMFVRKEVLYRADFAYFLAEAVTKYIQNQ